MNKKMRELMASYEDTVKKAMSAETVEEKTSLMDKADEIKSELEVEKRIFESQKNIEPEQPKAFSAPATESVETKTAKAIRTLILGKAMTEGNDSKGGFTVPEDIIARAERLAEVNFSFGNEVTTTVVSTNSGSRTYLESSLGDAFLTVAEAEAISDEMAGPSYKRINYTIVDRAGFIPISNDLIDDSDESIVSDVTEWLSKSNIATDNKNILDIIKTKTQLTFNGIDSIKRALNVTLGQAYKSNAKIYVNDDGLNYLDTLKDDNNRYLLTPNPVEPTKMQLAVGATVVPVVVVPNEVLTSDVTYALTTDTAVNAEKIYYTRSGSEGSYVYTEVGSPVKSGLSSYYEATTKVPVIVGALKEGIVKFDRKSMTIASSNVATIGKWNGFAQNMTLLRAIARNDYKMRDDKAFVFGGITF